MNKFLKVLIFVFIGIVQLTLMPIFQIKGIFPNIVLIMALTLALLDFQSDAYLLAVIGGLILDLGGFKIFGVNTIIILGLTLLARFICVRYLPDINIFVFALAIFVFTSIYVLLINIIAGQFAGSFILIDSAYSTFLSLIVFWQLQKYHSTIAKIESI